MRAFKSSFALLLCVAGCTGAEPEQQRLRGQKCAVESTTFCVGNDDESGTDTTSWTGEMTASGTGGTATDTTSWTGAPGTGGAATDTTSWNGDVTASGTGGAATDITSWTGDPTWPWTSGAAPDTTSGVGDLTTDAAPDTTSGDVSTFGTSGAGPDDPSTGDSTSSGASGAGSASTSGPGDATASGTSIASVTDSDSDSEGDWFDLPQPQQNPCSAKCEGPANPPEDLATVYACAFTVLENSSTGDVLRCAQNLACALGRDPTLVEFLEATRFHQRVSHFCTGSTQSGQPALYDDGTLVDPRCIVGSFVEGGLWCSFNLNDDTAIECVKADFAKVCGRNPIAIDLQSLCEDMAPIEAAFGKAIDAGVNACTSCHQGFDPKTRRIDAFADKTACFNFPIDGGLLNPGPPGDGTGLIACPSAVADPTDASEFLISADKTIDPTLDCDPDLKALENNDDYLEDHPEQIEVLRMLCPNTVIGGAKLQPKLDPLPTLPQLQPVPVQPPP